MRKITWFKVDDGFYDHPKFEGVSMAARGLWLTCGAYCSRHLTDGVISARRVRKLGGTPAQVSALIRARLWSEFVSDLGVKCYAIHDWNEYQPSRDSVLNERALSAERQRKSRERKRAEQEQQENVTRDSGVVSRVTGSEVSRGVSRRPDPTRPDPTIEERKGKKENEQVAHNQTVSPPPSSFIPYGSLDDPRCARHRDLPKEQVPACRDCGKVREVWQQRADDAKAEKRRVIDECDWCDSRGIAELHDADGRPVAVKCDHTNPPQPPPPPEPFKPLRTKKKPLW